LKLYSSNHATLLYPHGYVDPPFYLDLGQQCNAPNGLHSAVCRHRQTRYRSSADGAGRHGRSSPCANPIS